MKRRIAMVGGDIREGIAADIIIKHGYKLTTYVVPHQKGCVRPEDCLTAADILFLPVRSNLPDGSVYSESGEKILLSEKDFSLLKPDAVIYGGAVSERLKNEIAKSNRCLKEFMEYDEIAVPNAVLTAEGTLYEMMSLSAKGFSEWKIGIFGAGRVGKACAGLLQKVGAKVTVFCRREADLKNGRKDGFDMRFYSGFGAISPHLDFLINTVPAPVVTEAVLREINTKTVIIDLSSAPGGVDFDFAKQKGIKAFLLPGIPGKYAPVTAGKILGKYYLAQLNAIEEVKDCETVKR